MTHSIRVLHLEDSPRDAEIIRHRLDVADIPCDIVLANSRDSFEAALTREPFDLIISDYNLPGYDGVTAVKRAQATQPDVPVILISGTLVEEEAVRCLQIGATDYLVKGRLDRLVPAVQRALQDAETRRARNRVERALSESEARKAAILDSVLDCIVTIDGNGTVIEFNAAAARTFGYTKADAIGRSLADLIIPPRFRERHRAGLAHYLATGDGPLIGKVIEIMAMRSNGAELPVELTITALRSGSAMLFTGVLRDITARQQAEVTRARLAAIVDSSDDAIVSIAMDDTILTWNAGAERLYGYAASEMIGRSRALLVPAGQSAELVSIMERAARGEAGEPLETRRTRKDGSVVDVSLVISPMIDANGRITSVSTIARDITGRKKAETLLRDERDRAQQYLDTAEVMLLKLDSDGRILLLNRYGCALLGWTADELLGREWIETCVPISNRADARTDFLHLCGGELSVSESPVLTRAGEARLVEWRCRPLRDEAGRVVGSFRSGNDITERNLSIEARRKTEERMRFVLEAAGVGIWDMDCTTQAVQWSEILETQYGLKPGTFGGTLESFIALVHLDDRESLVATVGQAMKTGGDFSILHHTTCPDGTLRWLSGAGRVLLGEEGEPVRAVGISLDVTERHTLEQQYQQAQKMEAIGRLAGGVAHDFNNLLTVILGYCELLLAGLNPDDTIHADIAEIQKAGASAAGLTRQLLAFSRKEIIQPTSLDLNVVVADTRAMLARLIGEDVTIVLELDTALSPVKADRGQVEQMVLNLAVNARDAMPKGGRLTIETANIELDERFAKTHVPVNPGPYVVLTVADTGTGMTPEVRARVFEPFFTTKEPGKGTGLGLATVFGIATQSGGTITVESQVGSGTSFRVYFPRADTAELVVAAPPPVARSRVGIQTVLVVEDADGLRELTKRLLEKQGYTVLLAANADEALRLFDEYPSIDLLLADVVMPGASGPELVKQLVERRPTLKVIYMSGYTDDAIVHHGVLDPGIVFLHKPFSSESLGQKIREVIDR
jgi:two-component system cell cycle sensor histidine kinase/response regulator CckA